MSASDDQVPRLEAAARPRARGTCRGLGCSHCHRPVHGHDTGGAGVQAAGRARHRGRHGSLRRGVQRVATSRPISTPSTCRALEAELARLDQLPGRAGYFTETFCQRSRFFTPENGARIDAIRDAIATDHTGTPLEPLLLTSLIEAADRVDSTTGVQMAYLKQWAPRAHQPVDAAHARLFCVARAARSAVTRSSSWRAIGSFDLAYLDPPYNQHRYFTNYHVWETLVAWDAPEHYGVACKRIDARDDATRSAFNSRRTMPDALAAVIAGVDAELVVVSYNDEAWLTLDELIAMCAVGGRHVAVLGFDSKRYVGRADRHPQPEGRARRSCLAPPQHRAARDRRAPRPRRKGCRRRGGATIPQSDVAPPLKVAFR